MADETTSVLMVGVGGQGIVVASDVLAQAASHAGYDVKKSEVHGMSQRGGSVTSDVRYGERVYSPRTAPGEVDYLVAFEKLEALRFLHYLAPGGILIVNDQEILPATVTSGGAEYPRDILERLAERTSHVEIIPAVELATKAGNVRAANTALLGALSRHLDLPLEAWKEALQERIPAKALEVNLKVFDVARRIKSRAAAERAASGTGQPAVAEASTSQQKPGSGQKKATRAKRPASRRGAKTKKARSP
jgi:indolepyruvate ferredoxin oxidoreductase beta subunit